MLLVRAVKKKGKCKVLQKSGRGGLEKELAVKKAPSGFTGVSVAFCCLSCEAILGYAQVGPS